MAGAPFPVFQEFQTVHREVQEVPHDLLTLPPVPCPPPPLLSGVCPLSSPLWDLSLCPSLWGLSPDPPLFGVCPLSSQLWGLSLSPYLWGLSLCPSLWGLSPGPPLFGVCPLSSPLWGLSPGPHLFRVCPLSSPFWGLSLSPSLRGLSPVPLSPGSVPCPPPYGVCPCPPLSGVCPRALLCLLVTVPYCYLSSTPFQGVVCHTKGSCSGHFFRPPTSFVCPCGENFSHPVFVLLSWVWVLICLCLGLSRDTERPTAESSRSLMRDCEYQCPSWGSLWLLFSHVWISHGDPQPALLGPGCCGSHTWTGSPVLDKEQ